MQSHITSPINGLSANGTFNKAAGTLVVNVTGLLTDNNQRAGGQDTLMFTFDVINRYKKDYGGYRDNDNTLQIGYSLKSTSIAGVQQTTVVTLQGSGRDFMFRSTDELSTSYSIDTNLIDRDFHEQDVDTTMQGLVRKPQAGDARPLFIRPAFFQALNITQSSPYPCDDNNILTVTLVSSVPLRTRSGYCNPTITIAGLVDYVTPNNMFINIIETAGTTRPNQAGVSSIFGGTGQWRQQAGSLVLNVTEGQGMLAGRANEFSF